MSATSNYKIWVEGKLKTDTLQKQLNDFQKKIKDIKIKVNVTGSTQLKDMNTQLKDVSANTATAQQSAYKLATEFNNLKSTVLGLYSTLKGLTQPVFELDASLTEFKKVSDLSGDSLDAYVNKLKGLRTEVGRSTAEMVDAATEFKKSGYSEADSAELAQIASMYQNIADEEISTGDAANFIIAQMKAFGVEAEDSMHIIDAVNEVSNNYAISSADLATNIGKVSSVMATTNTTYEETLGMMTAITEITRNAGKAANGLKTLATNFIKIVDPASSDGVQMLAVLDKLGISAYDADGQLRPMYDTLKDLNGVWGTLDTNSQDYIASLFAGANQIQTFTSLMSNFGTAISATDTAMTSQGSAAEENEKAMESLQKSVDNLKAAWADLINNLIESGVIKELIDKVTAFVTSLSEKDAHEMINNIKTIIGLFVAFKGLSIAGELSASTKGFTELSGALKLFSNIRNIAEGIEALSTATGGLGGAIKLLAPELGILLAIVAAFKGLQVAGGWVREQNIEEAANHIDFLNDKLKKLEGQGKKDSEEYKEAIKNLKTYTDMLQSNLRARYNLGDVFAQDSSEGPSNFQKEINDYNYWLAESEKATGGYSQTVQRELQQSKEAIGKYVDSTSGAVEAGVELTDTELKTFNAGLAILGKTATGVGEEVTDVAEETGSTVSDTVKATTEEVNLFTETLINQINSGVIGFYGAINQISNSNLDFSQQLGALQKIKDAFGETTAAGLAMARLLEDLTTVTSAYANMKTPFTDSTGRTHYRETFATDAAAQAAALKTVLERAKNGAYSYGLDLTQEAINIVPKGTTGASSNASSNASSKTVDPIKEENDAYKENIAILEHRIEMMKRNGATEEELIAEYEKMKNIVHKQAEKYRAMGLNENSEYIRDLQNQWWGYADDIQDLYDEMDKKRKEALEKQRDETQKYLDALQVYADEQAEKLEKEKATQDKAFDERIEQLQAEKKALDEQNEAIEEQNRLKELQQKLDSAKEKRIQVYHEGVGFTWDEDTEAIQEAQSDLEEEQRQQALKQQKAAIDEKISLIEQEKEDTDEYYDGQIDAWRNFSTKYSKIEDRIKARQILAKDKEKDNLDERLGNFESFKDDYVRAANELIQINNSLGESNINPSDVISSLIQAGVITGDWFKNATKSTETHASGTVRFKGGLTSINENGAEMLIPPSLNTLANLPTGTGIVPHNITQNLMELGKYSLNGLKRLLGGGTSYNFSGTTFSFPNMTNNSSINQFIKDLSNFENSAIQSSYSRI